VGARSVTSRSGRENQRAVRSFHPIRRLGLRARLTLSFALGAAALSAVLSITAWGLTRENLLKQRDENAVKFVFSNAATVNRTIDSLTPSGDNTNGQYEKLIASLPTPEGAQPVIYDQGEWFAKSAPQFGQDAIPARLQAMVTTGQPARMRYTHDGTLWLTVGVPLPNGASYFEGSPLAEVSRTLDGLAISLIGASALTTLAGGLFGFWISRRALTPLADVGRAALAIAAGNLDTRLVVSGDPELDMLTTSFNDMAQGLQDRIERDARFASEVSHELRSPLMTLAAALEVLNNMREELPDRAQMALDLMKTDVDRFQQLVEDLLEISRFDVGAIKLHLEEVLVADLVLAAVSMASNAAGESAVPVSYDEDVSEVVVRLDKRRFARVLANLLDNAQKYAGGATAVKIELAPFPAVATDNDAEPPTPLSFTVADESPEPETEKVWIAVEDHGHGVPESERERIFNRFSRGTEGGNRGADTGVGLGLALVDEHVRLHGGRVWVEDRTDGEAGARFVVELPVVPELEDSHPDASPEDLA